MTSATHSPLPVLQDIPECTAPHAAGTALGACLLLRQSGVAAQTLPTMPWGKRILASGWVGTQKNSLGLKWLRVHNSAMFVVPKTDENWLKTLVFVGWTGP